jgi:hypothetical protein
LPHLTKAALGRDVDYEVERRERLLRQPIRANARTEEQSE